MDLYKQLKATNPKFNTIDFMVSVVNKDGEQNIHTSIQDGKNMTGTSDVIEYTEIILRTGFNETLGGYSFIYFFLQFLKF